MPVKTTLPSGRPSICQWSLRAEFKTKDQATKAIKLLLDEDIDFNVEYSIDLDATHTLYVVEVHDMAWAANLSTVAAILESVDHKDK